MNLRNLVTNIKAISSNLNDVQNIEHAKISSFHWFNIIQTKEDRLISDKAFTGIDIDPATALAKANSEMIERKVFSVGHNLGLRSCLTERSDGFAAYPKSMGLLNIEKARENALAEAIERYAWANWWDDHDISYSHKMYSLSEFTEIYSTPAKMLTEINTVSPVKKIHVISPDFTNHTDHQLIILVAEIKNGLVTGGACGKIADINLIMVRAMSELFRHALVSIQNKQQPKILSLYEQRLLYFLTSEGLNTFYERVRHNGSKQVVFPKLAFDEIIPIESTHTVYRCLFENQPQFIGGAIDRMCL